jgi:hypothetical protein
LASSTAPAIICDKTIDSAPLGTLGHRFLSNFDLE